MQLLTKNNLHNYQRETVNKIKDLKRCALFFDMSLGKTVTTLTAISDLLWFDDIQKVLIIAPLRVANTVWKQETERWEHLQWLNNHISICTGTIQNKLKALKSKHKILVTNRDNIQWLNINLVKNHHPYDMIIIDESSSFKNPSSQRFKMVRKLCFEAKYLVLLTGTPSPNSLLELWPQIFLIDQGERLGKTFYNFKNNYFYPAGFGGFRFKPRKDTHQEIKTLLEDICITLRAKDYIELPDKIISNYFCEFDAKNRQIYKNMEDDFIVELSNSAEPITAVNAAAKIGKLLQFCNGFMYGTEREVHYFHSLKIDLLKEIIENYPDDNILVAYNFQYDLELLEKSFLHAVKMDKKGEIVEKWNQGKIKMLLAHPASAGHGLNLQSGGAIIVWYSMVWSLENYLQFNARLHRQGQLKPVKIVHLLVKNSVDEYVLSVLQDKDNIQTNFIESLKLRLMERASDGQ